MSPRTDLPPLRVEQALRLLPDVDALGPLRAFLVSTSREQPSGEPHRTVGKRYVQPDDLRELVPQAIGRVSDHLRVLYEAAVEALGHEQRGDFAGAVRALVRAGGREQRAGRFSQARIWYEHALRLAEGLHDRRPEIETLRRLGDLEATRDHFEAGARCYQRSLALADAEMDPGGAALACQGLGDLARTQERWQGAESWYTRGLRYAEDDALASARLHLGLAEVARNRGQVEAAEERLRLAGDLFASKGHAAGAVLVHNAWGLLEAQCGRHAEALDHYHRALARLHGAGGSSRLEMLIRLNICQLYVDWGRLPDAEDEVRRAEETAIAHNFTRHLARLYVLMGKLSGRQGDENGFVFFEKAIELSRGIEPFPRLEAEVYMEYGRFRSDLGEPDEARAYLERAREILDTLGDGPLLARVDGALAGFQAR